MSTQSKTPRLNWKLPVRFTPLVFAFFMSGIMAFLMCLVITAANTGFSDNYLLRAFRAYQLAMPVACGCVLCVRPIVMKLVRMTVSQ